MKHFSSTSASTIELPDLWRTLLPPEYCRLTLEIADVAQRHLDSRRAAGATRSAGVRPGIEACYRAHQGPLEQIPLELRPRELMKKLRADLAVRENNGTCGYDLDLERLPCRDTAKKVVEHLAPENKRCV